MSNGRVDPPHGEEPDLDREEYEDLDDIAEDAREARPASSATKEAITAASDAANALDTRDLIARAESVCLGNVSAPGEAFSDPAPNDTHTSLLRTAGGLATGLGALGRRRARAEFLAFHLGFVAANHHGPTADSVLTLLSRALAGKDKPAASINQLATAWFLGEGSIFQRMAERYAEADPQGRDLADHIVFMSIAADLRSNTPEKDFLWDDRVEMLELVEELIAGMNPGDAIDIGELYRRADALVKGGRYFPPQVAEVTRLAMAALAGDRVPVRNVPDATTAAVLDNMARQLDRVTRKAQGDLTQLPGEASARIPVLRAAEFELGEVWQYCQGRLALELADAPDRKRSPALDAALGDKIGSALAALSEARRSGTPTDIPNRATAVSEALADAESRVRSILGDLKDLDRMKKLAVEADALKLIWQTRERVAELCRDAALGRDRGTGRFDAAITLARLQTERGIVSEIARQMRPGVTADDIGTAVERLPGRFRNAPWSLGVVDSFAKWSDAATTRRLDADTRLDAKDPGKSVVWPGLGDATRAVATSIGAARAGAAGLGSADKSQFNGALDEGLFRISAWLRSTAALKDSTVMSVDPATLATLIEAQTTPVEIVTDVEQSWKADKPDLAARVPRGTDLELKQHFHEALHDWEAAVHANPRNDDKIVARTWAVLSILSDYRAAVKSTITDRDLVSMFTAAFDKIAASIAARLAALK